MQAKEERLFCKEKYSGKTDSGRVSVPLCCESRMGVSSRYIPDVREVKAFRAHRSPIHIAQQLGGGNFTKRLTGVHSMENTATVFLGGSDLYSFLEKQGCRVRWADFTQVL